MVKSFTGTGSRPGFARAFIAGIILFLLPGADLEAQLQGFVRTTTDTVRPQTVSMSEDKVTTSDSMRIASEYGKGGIETRRVFLWNRNIPQSRNLGSASSVYASAVNTTPVRDITNILSGRMSGLYTVQTSGKVGSDGATLSLRGQTPLMVIDGVVRNFTNFNPDDIKSITVLKDALSTAMYGLRSSDGVILVTTKDMGQRNFELNFSAQTGFLAPIRRPQFLGAYDYATLYNEAQQNSNPGASPKYADSVLAVYKNGTNDPTTQPNINWYNDVVKPSTRQQRYSISAGGFGKNYHYYASLERFSQSGIFVTAPFNSYNTNNDNKRYNVRLNAEVDFSKNIILNLNLFGSIVNGAEPGVTADAIMGYIYTTPPMAYPRYNPDGSYGGSTLWTSNVRASTVSSGYLLNNDRTINADMSLKYKFDDLVKGLWASGSISMNNYFLEQINRSKTFAVYQYAADPTGGANPTYTKINSDGTVGTGSYTLNQTYNQTYYNLMAGYDRSWRDNNLHLLAAYNGDNAGTSLVQLSENYRTAGLTASWDWRKKYLAELAMSYSGLNYYPPGKGWAFLPSLGLGWVVSDESFFHVTGVQYLKVKGSIGQTAWGDPGYFSYIQNYIIGSSTYGYNIGSTATSVSGAYEDVLANPHITWEKAWKYNGGVEAVLLKNRLNLSIEYYNNYYYDQLISPASTSGIFGQTYPLMNLGKKRYYGLETSAGYENSYKAFSWFVKGNISIAYSKVLDAAEPDYSYPWQYKKGSPVNQTFGYESLGLYTADDVAKGLPHIAGYTPVAGDIKYKDLNGDGIINNLDQHAIGKTSPLIFFGVNAGIRWKGFDVSLLLQGVENRNQYIASSSALIEEFYNGYGNVQAFHLNRWTAATAATATYPRLTVGGNTNNTAVSSFWMKNGSYLRIKNAEIGYSLPRALLRRASIRDLRFFVNCYNLVTWTRLKDFHLDPESATNSYYPNQRIINTGVTLSL